MRFGPQALQVVELARFFGLDVQNRVAVVEDNPQRVGIAFAPRADAVVAQFVEHVVRDGLDVRVRGARDDDEIVGQNRLVAHVEDGDVKRLDFVGALTNQRGFVARDLRFERLHVECGLGWRVGALLGFGLQLRVQIQVSAPAYR